MTLTASPAPARSAALVIARVVVDGIRHSLPEHASLFDARATEFVASVLEHDRKYAALGIAAGADAFRQVGVAEYAAGKGLERLSRAFHSAGRAALPVLASLSRLPGAGSSVMDSGVEALLRCADVLIRLSTAAYRAAHTPSVAELRQDLLKELLGGRPPAKWAALAAEAGWIPPARVVAVAAEPGAVRASFGPEVLADLTGEYPHLLVPDDLEIGGVLAGTRAAVGPAVAPAEAAVSLRWARRTLELVRREVIEDGPLVRWSDHLTTHWLFADEVLTSALVTRSLAPIADLPANERTKLAETLDAMLAARGGAPEIAENLGVHPQTVRNRLRRLRVLFGSRLDDPQARLDLRIALRVELLTPEPAGTATPIRAA
ncbi:helix-turn-helix domain-containing protein [Amycolatopsis sp. QT-25]|uniref:PucR family transcriptional regulator n=1 Tax=Amycolatopsis sp. QT-25 TaxID=3034022 RepID=UPI0023EC4495|nr:helix-turn-helix domain-containing protein [Amycolatopsis sp. QT-25]WET82742.1 helix-turn-helix domain-containing protein [Amycolatopsis sp. QT-25]